MDDEGYARDRLSLRLAAGLDLDELTSLTAHRQEHEWVRKKMRAEEAEAQRQIDEAAKQPKGVWARTFIVLTSVGSVIGVIAGAWPAVQWIMATLWGPGR